MRWNRQASDGFFPPPPLNGTAHTWHHDLQLLRRIIHGGGVNSGGRMPPFAGLLDAGDIDAVSAAFQSNWPDDIYDRWSGAYAERHPLPPIIREILGEGG